MSGRIVLAGGFGVGRSLNIRIVDNAQSGLDARFEPFGVIGRQGDIAKTIPMSSYLAKAVVGKG